MKIFGIWWVCIIFTGYCASRVWQNSLFPVAAVSDTPRRCHIIPNTQSCMCQRYHDIEAFYPSATSRLYISVFYGFVLLRRWLCPTKAAYSFFYFLVSLKGRQSSGLFMRHCKIVIVWFRLFRLFYNFWVAHCFEKTLLKMRRKNG